MDDIPYRLERSPRRTTAIHVERDGTVIARAPRWVPGAWIARFVRQHAEWIQQTRLRFQQEAQLSPPIVYSAAERQNMKETVELHIQAILPELANRMNVRPKRFRVGFAKRRWGSCSAKGNLRFNARLALVPPEMLEYVVVHELAHLREMNHSPAFWRVVAECIPDFKARRHWLRRHPTHLD